MNPERARELLGGLTAGILTPEERQTLFEAALHDQVLFNEVADELEFAAFLESPEARAQLANRIEVAPQRRPWWALHPRWLALSGALVASIVVFVALWHRPGEIPHGSVVAPAPAATVSAPPVSAPAAQPAPKPVVRSAPQTMAKSVSRSELKPAPVAQRAEPAPSPSFAPMAPAAAPPPPPATASLDGTVRDPAGAPIPGAAVDIANPNTNTTAHATSDANGRFTATSLPQGGPYTVTAVAPGFAQKKQSGITLAENQRTQVDIPLEIGQTSETVAVTAAAPVLASPRKEPVHNLTQVAVLDFANPGGQNQSGAQAADLLSSQLGNSGQVRVIDRDKVQQAVQSQNAVGHPPSAQEAAAVGRKVGADAVITGSVQAQGILGGIAGAIGALDSRKAAAKAAPKAAPNVSITAEIIDTRQALPLGTVSAGGASLQRATASVGSQIQSRLAKPSGGKVTKVNGEIVAVQFDEPPVPAVGAHCDVLRGAAKIGEIVITSASGQSAVGKFSGAGQPLEGDRVTASR